MKMKSRELIRISGDRGQRPDARNRDRRTPYLRIPPPLPNEYRNVGSDHACKWMKKTDILSDISIYMR